MKFYRADNKRPDDMEALIQKIQKAFPETPREAIINHIEESLKDEVWLNDKYQVSIHKNYENLIHLSIKRIDKEAIHDWRDLQEIKNALVGPEFGAAELYPKESRLVDTANQYHLWVLKEGEFPFGFKDGRHVVDGDGTTEKDSPRQRPLKSQ